jgi:hypothetical protein
MNASRARSSAVPQNKSWSMGRCAPGPRAIPDQVIPSTLNADDLHRIMADNWDSTNIYLPVGPSYSILSGLDLDNLGFFEAGFDLKNIVEGREWVIIRIIF